MRSYHFGLKPLLSIMDAQAPLPDDTLWGVKTSDEWTQISRDRNGENSA
jgi:hypothetical protein